MIDFDIFVKFRPIFLHVEREGKLWSKEEHERFSMSCKEELTCLLIKFNFWLSMRLLEVSQITSYMRN